MALQSSGAISMYNIRTEKGLSGQVSLTSMSTQSINTYQASKPDQSTPHRIKEFYGYQQLIYPTVTFSYPGYSANIPVSTLNFVINNGYETGFTYEAFSYDDAINGWYQQTQLTNSYAGTSGSMDVYNRNYYASLRIAFTVVYNAASSDSATIYGTYY